LIDLFAYKALYLFNYSIIFLIISLLSTHKGIPAVIIVIISVDLSLFENSRWFWYFLVSVHIALTEHRAFEFPQGDLGLW
jgi:hypothetical protein